MADEQKQTVIEDGTEFEGSMKSSCGVQLSGKVRGQLSAPSLTVMPSGAVEGQVKVSELRSSGEISGEIEAASVELSGTVSDETIIRAASLEVKLAQPSGGIQVTFGNCELEVGKHVAKDLGVPAKVEAKKSVRATKEAPSPVQKQDDSGGIDPSMIEQALSGGNVDLPEKSKK